MWLINRPSLSDLTSTGTNTAARRLLYRTTSLVARNGAIGDKDWNARHSGVVKLLWLHALALPAVGVYSGSSTFQSMAAGALIALMALAACWRAPGRTVRAVIASLGLLSCSAILVHFTHGNIETHFHFFVMVAILALYEDWIPYFAAIIYIVMEHGFVGQFMPTSVYDSPDAFTHPWKWAFIHAGFVLCMIVAQQVSWRASTRARLENTPLEPKDVMQLILLEKQKTERIIDEITDGVIITGPGGNILLINPAARKHLLGDTVQSPPVALSQITNDPRILEIFEDHNEAVTREFEVYDGAHLSTRLFTATAVPLKGDSELLLGQVTVFRDITHYKEADRLKSEFISHVSHELRTPLTAIKGYIDNLRDGLGGLLTVKQISYLDRMTINTNHLAHLIGDLLDISKIDAGKMNLTPTPLSMKHLIEDVIKDMRPIVAQHQLEMTFDPPTHERQVNGDRDRLKQVMVNLLDNAVKYTPPGGRITVTLRQDKQSLTTTVRDTGIGIPVEKQSRVFECFSRIKRESPAPANGTGLGLYIAKHIIEMHGGRIRLLSETGKGCEFSFVLPSLTV